MHHNNGTQYTAAHVGLGHPSRFGIPRNSFFIWEGLSLYSLPYQKTEAKYDMRNSLEGHQEVLAH